MEILDYKLASGQSSKIPELIPRITPERIRVASKLGKATDLRAMIAFLRLFGVFGNARNSLRYVARRMYATSRYQAPCEQSGQLCWKTNDVAAYQRLDNVISGKKSMIAEELEFFRLCLRKAFGDNYAAMITNEEIRLGKAHLTVRRLLCDGAGLDWTNIDPMQAIQNFALLSKPCLKLNTIIKNRKHRWIDREGGPDVEFPNFQPQKLHPGSEFHIEISKEYCPKAPIVLEFSHITGIDAHGNRVRAQLLPVAKATDDGYGPWRVSEPYAKPFVVSKNLGRFGFLAIGGAGHSIQQLLPNGCNLYALTNEDLKFLHETLAQIGSSGGMPSFGLLYYEVN